MTKRTRLRLTILQFRQTFFTDACTFISFLPNFQTGDQYCPSTDPPTRKFYCLTPDHAGPAVRFQIGLFHQAVVLMRYQVRLYLGDKVHDHNNHNQD